MPKAYLKFNLPEESEDFELALKGASTHYKLEEVWDRVFRPYRKHGYGDPEINKIIEDNPEVADKIIEYLIGLYLEVKNEG